MIGHQPTLTHPSNGSCQRLMSCSSVKAVVNRSPLELRESPSCPVSGSSTEDGAPMGSNLGAFGKGRRVFDVDSEIAHRILDFTMAKKDLDGTKVAGGPVDDRSLGPPKRVGAIFASHQTHPRNPIIASTS
jgi:hypothetical protein